MNTDPAHPAVRPSFVRRAIGRACREGARWRDRLALQASAVAARVLPPYGAAGQHPVFARFASDGGEDAGMDTDFLGIRTQPEMLLGLWQSGHRAGQPPGFDEEYFEWIDVLESVEQARDSYTVVEFGAGYARWAARGWVAAGLRGLRAHVGVVEAEPQHVVWARSHLAFNGVPDGDITFFESAVGTAPGSTVFLVEMPAGSAGNNPRDWFGQAVAEARDGQATEALYHGKPLLDLPGGWRGVEVAVEDIHAMLARFERIDLADFDVQGMELALIAAAADALTEKVARLHIGTHSRAIDKALPPILASRGWRCLRAYPCLRWNRTEFGWIRFNDGVQSWVNPRLAL